MQRLFERLKNSSVGRSFLALSFWQMTNYLVPLVTMPYLIRTIGTEKFGLISYIQAFLYYFIVFVDFGFSTTAVREISIARNDTVALTRIFYTTIFTKLLLGLISLVIIITVILFVPRFRDHWQSYIMGFSLVIGQVLFPVWFFQGIEKMKYITYLNFVAKLIFAILLFVLVRGANDYPFALAAQGIGLIIASLIGIMIIKLRFKIKFYWPHSAMLVKEIKSGFPILISNFSVTAYNSSLYLLVGFYENDQVLGVYSIAEKITALIRQILSTFSQAIFPRVCSLVTQGQAELRKFWRKILMPFAIGIVSICLLVCIFSSTVVTLVTGDNLSETAKLLSVIIWVPVIVYFNIPSFQILLAYNYKTVVMQVLTASSLFSIVLSWFLVPRFSILGAAYSLIITECIITLSLFVMLKKKLHFTF